MLFVCDLGRKCFQKGVGITVYHSASARFNDKLVNATCMSRKDRHLFDLTVFENKIILPITIRGQRGGRRRKYDRYYFRCLSSVLLIIIITNLFHYQSFTKTRYNPGILWALFTYCFLVG